MPNEMTHMVQVKAYACNCGFRAEGPNVVQHMNDHIKVCPLVPRLYADETTQPADLTADATRLLKAIEVFPGSSWPGAYEIEGMLLRDVHARRDDGRESPWAGGTLAASRFMAAAPVLVRELLSLLAARDAEIARLTAERDSAVAAERRKDQQLEHRTLTLGAAVKRAEQAEAEIARLTAALDHVRAIVHAPSQATEDLAIQRAGQAQPPQGAERLRRAADVATALRELAATPTEDQR